VTKISRSDILAKSVIRGSRGFLFHRDHDTIEQLSGNFPLSSSDLENWRTSFINRFNFCEKLGIDFRVLFVPEKHVVYSDLIPDLKISNNRPVIQLLNMLPSKLLDGCIYPIAEMKNARVLRDLYYKTDTHWNYWGAYLCYDLLMESFASKFPLDKVRLNDIKIISRNYIGDLGVRLEPEEGEFADVFEHAKYLPFKRVIDNSVFNRGSVAGFVSPRSKSPSVLIFRDSFFNLILPHFVPVFSKVLAVSSLNMHYDLVRLFKPNIVLFEIVERFVGYGNGIGGKVLINDQFSGFKEFSGLDPQFIANSFNNSSLS
jgi:alginate O-acetyltransferase complex protein AlgJ